MRNLHLIVCLRSFGIPPGSPTPCLSGKSANMATRRKKNKRNVWICNQLASLRLVKLLSTESFDSKQLEIATLNHRRLCQIRWTSSPLIDVSLGRRWNFVGLGLVRLVKLHRATTKLEFNKNRSSNYIPKGLLYLVSPRKTRRWQSARARGRELVVVAHLLCNPRCVKNMIFTRRTELTKGFPHSPMVWHYRTKLATERS